MYIARVKIANYRNFKEIDLRLEQHSVLVGGNKAGKSNLIRALQLALDPNLPPNARKLQGADFFDGEPSFNGRKIVVEVDLLVDEAETTSMYSLAAMISKEGEQPRARFTYRFEPDPIKIHLGEDDESDQTDMGQSYHPTQYRYVWFPGNNEDKSVNPNKLNNFINFTLLAALRDTQDLLSTWSKSPLKTLLENADIAREFLQETAQNIRSQVEPLGQEIKPIVTNVENRSNVMVGNIFSVGSSLNVVTDEPEDLLRSVKLYIDGDKQRNLSQASLGTLNVLYLALLLEEAHQEYLKRKKLQELESESDDQETLPGLPSPNKRHILEQQMILALEEPEAHLHPHVQRSIFRYFLTKESTIKSLIVTTHSPHIVSVAGIERIIILRNINDYIGTKGYGISQNLFTDDELDDINRYLDVTRGELLFSRGVIFVEGIAELYLIPAFARSMEINLDYLGISVVSVHGTDFLPYVKLVSQQGLNIPFVVITDGDQHLDGDDDGEEISFQITPGEKRGIDLIEKLNPQYDIDDVQSCLETHGIFVGNYTLEVDLLPYYFDEIKDVYSSLVQTDRAVNAFQQHQEAAINGDTKSYLDRISRKGKGRFAQKLAELVKPDQCPDYIRDALSHIVAQLQPHEVSVD